MASGTRVAYVRALQHERISCGPDGAWARNMVLDYCFPWGSTREVLPSDRVVIRRATTNGIGCGPCRSST